MSGYADAILTRVNPRGYADGLGNERLVDTTVGTSASA